MTTTKAAQYSSSTDVAVMMAAGTGQQQNWYAWTTCVTGGSNCDQFTVTFSSINPHSDYWSVGCHELGHTIGLRDGQAATYGTNSSTPTAQRSCMRTNPDHRYYSTHDKGHVNGRY